MKDYNSLSYIRKLYKDIHKYKGDVKEEKRKEEEILYFHKAHFKIVTKTIKKEEQ